MRTKNSLKNIISVVVFNLIIGILGFIKVKVFVGGLTDDIYSVHQLFYQIFGYLTIADIGFGLVLNKNFYEAFAKDDKKIINKIYSTSRKFYNIIGIFMMACALVISFFVSYLTKANIDNSYLQLIFIIFIFRNVLDYFFVAPRFVMDADQKNYKINYLLKSAKILEIVSEIVLVLLKVNYVFILIPGIFITLFFDLYINRKVYREYPFLHNDKSFDKEYLNGTKDLISLKLTGLANSNTDIILLSAFVNPISVIIYTSYSYITKFVSDTIFVAASAITPSFANVLNKEGEEKAYSVFKEINIFFLFIASFSFIMLYTFLNNLIILWIGREYLASNLAAILFCLICFYNIANRSFVITINSKGLFKETKAIMMVEAILNIILSLLLIKKLSLVGVLLGTVVASYTTTFIYEAFYLHRKVFNKNILKYFITYFSVLALSFGCIYALSLYNFPIYNVISFIGCVLIISVVVALFLFICLFIMFKEFRDLVDRGLLLLKGRKK